MKEQGIVRMVEGKQVVLQRKFSEVCFGCMNQECKKSGGLTTVLNSQGFPLRPGQLVETEIAPALWKKELLLVVLPPVAAFILCYILSGFLPLGEGARALVSSLFLFLSALIIYFHRRKNREQELPVITAVM